MILKKLDERRETYNLLVSKREVLDKLCEEIKTFENNIVNLYNKITVLTPTLKFDKLLTRKIRNFKKKLTKYTIKKPTN